jgi:hypothetical protein
VHPIPPQYSQVPRLGDRVTDVSSGLVTGPSLYAPAPHTSPSPSFSAADSGLGAPLFAVASGHTASYSTLQSPVDEFRIDGSDTACEPTLLPRSRSAEGYYYEQANSAFYSSSFAPPAHNLLASTQVLVAQSPSCTHPTYLRTLTTDTMFKSSSPPPPHGLGTMYDMGIATHYNYPASSIGASSTTRTSPTAVSPSSSSPGSNAMSSDLRPYAELDRPYVKVVKDEDEKGPGDLEFSDQSDCDEQEVVPAATPLNGSFVDLAQELKDTYGGDVPSAEATSPSSDAASDRKRRARFGEDQRKETSETRNLGACMRCHNQRIRVRNNDRAPLFSPQMLR